MAIKTVVNVSVPTYTFNMNVALLIDLFNQ